LWKQPKYPHAAFFSSQERMERLMPVKVSSSIRRRKKKYSKMSYQSLPRWRDPARRVKYPVISVELAGN
jgi:hypothetical protein